MYLTAPPVGQIGVWNLLHALPVYIAFTWEREYEWCSTRKSSNTCMHLGTPIQWLYAPSSVKPTLVKREFLLQVSIAFGLLWVEVPGATPKNPNSGLIAYKRPSGPGFIQQISSPTVSIFTKRNEEQESVWVDVILIRVWVGLKNKF